MFLVMFFTEYLEFSLPNGLLSLEILERWSKISFGYDSFEISLEIFSSNAEVVENFYLSFV